MTRKIRDTDVVYSAVSDDRSITRFALRPLLDGRPREFHERLPVRATYASIDGRLMYASCRSVGCSNDGGPWVIPRFRMQWAWADDGWLDWLAEGEGR